MSVSAASVPLDLAAIARIVDAGDTSIAACREALVAGRDAVHVAFEAGVPASALLAGRSAVVDLVLTRLWYRSGPVFDGLALLAVGGYGRAELHPASDIDLAIVLPDEPCADATGAPSATVTSAAAAGAARDEALSAWVTQLWDLDLDIGHSVRTIAECERQAAADITVITNLMEARFVAGDPGALARVRRVIAPERMWPSAAFFRAKLVEQAERGRRFRTNAYRLEPNVKESHGGLRDFQTIAWVCQREFGGTRGGAGDLAPLVDHGLLEPRELDAVREGLELLWRIRYLLHRLSGREEDRLLFEWQKPIAHAFGYADDVANRSIEALMQRFYRTVMRLQRLNEICLQGVGGIISGITEAATPVVLNRRFQRRNDYLEVVHDEVFLHYPPALLELFEVFATTPEVAHVRSNTVRLIRSHLKLVNDRFRSDPVVRALFVRIFSHAEKLTRTVRLMNGYGVLAAYLPAFDAIVGRMQYDLFHIYTVDEHTIRVIQNLRRFSMPEHAAELPRCSEVAARIAEPHVLYLAALFHDIAKGRGGDHSELGAEDVHAFATAHGFEARRIELMTWIVRHHLDMSMTAQRRDIDDPDVQLDFARHVGTLERLDHLYLLTVADIRATNPELWNSFKQSLLQALYRHARLILERGLDDALERDDVIANRQAHTRSMLEVDAVGEAALARLWENLGDDHFRQYQAADIARQTELLLAHGDSREPLVVLSHSAGRGAVEILIHAEDHAALFALIATVLEKLCLNVLSATIGTTAQGRALDTFHVLDTDGSLIEDTARVEEIRLALLAELASPGELPAPASQRASRRLRHFPVRTGIDFLDRDDGYTEVRITAADRPGILSSIGRVLLENDIAVHAALVATLGERIDDVFVVLRADGRPFFDPEARERLADALRGRL